MEGALVMKSLQQGNFEFNTNISFDFTGGNLSSDSGLLLVREFIRKIGLRKMLNRYFDDDKKRIHRISSVIEQLIYQSIAGYHADDNADDLRRDPIFTEILEKNALASQPTISRILNGFSEDDVKTFNAILEELYLLFNPASKKSEIVLDLDSTNTVTYGNQERSEYIVHYQKNGYHPLVLFDGLNGDLMKLILRKGSIYTSKGVKEFLEPVVDKLRDQYPQAEVIVRGDSGFAMPELYDLCEDRGLHYVIRLKANSKLYELAKDANSHFNELYHNDYSQDHELYDEFYYQAGSWSKPRRVICKVQRDAGSLISRTTFIITTLSAAPKDVVSAYNKRGNMENFIKELKLDFGVETLSHSAFAANQAKAMILGIAYMVINAMKRYVLPKKHQSKRMHSLRSFFVKIASRLVSHSRKLLFKFATSYPHQNTLYEMMNRIRCLSFG